VPMFYCLRTRIRTSVPIHIKDYEKLFLTGYQAYVPSMKKAGAKVRFELTSRGPFTQVGNPMSDSC